MSRIFDRLGPINFSSPSAVRRAWQKLVEEVETQITNINASLASMPDIAPVTVTADYAGTVDVGQLPRNVSARRLQNTTDVTTDSVWSFSVDSGSITASIGAATGVLTITALGSSSVVTITSTYGGVEKSRKLYVTKQLSAAPSSGSGGGTSASDSSFASINSASMATISDTLTVTVGSGGIVTLSAPLSVTTAATGPEAAYSVAGIWQWDSTGGGVWVDLGTESSSSGNVDVYSVNDDGAAPFAVNPGYVTISYSHTGLVAASSQSYRLRARNVSGTRTMYFSGTATAVGS